MITCKGDFIIAILRFKEHLLANPDLDLQFRYDKGKWVAPSYHITEIKKSTHSICRLRRKNEFMG
jgi:hypothetical protein